MRRIVTKIPQLRRAEPPAAGRRAGRLPPRHRRSSSGTTGSRQIDVAGGDHRQDQPHAQSSGSSRSRTRSSSSTRTPRPGVSQVEVGTDSESYEYALRAMMRQDPDTILIGEIRDPFSLSTALKAADTGHLVFTTVHATNALDDDRSAWCRCSTRTRRTCSRRSSALNLNAVICQRLAKKREGKGRIPVVEIMMATPIVRKYILDGEFDKLKGAVGNRESRQPELRPAPDGAVPEADHRRERSQAPGEQRGRAEPGPPRHQQQRHAAAVRRIGTSKTPSTERFSADPSNGGRRRPVCDLRRTARMLFVLGGSLDSATGRGRQHEVARPLRCTPARSRARPTCSCRAGRW